MQLQNRIKQKSSDRTLHAHTQHFILMRDNSYSYATHALTMPSKGMPRWSTLLAAHLLPPTATLIQLLSKLDHLVFYLVDPWSLNLLLYQLGVDLLEDEPLVDVDGQVWLGKLRERHVHSYIDSDCAAAVVAAADADRLEGEVVGEQFMRANACSFGQFAQTLILVVIAVDQFLQHLFEIVLLLKFEETLGHIDCLGDLSIEKINHAQIVSEQHL